MNTSNLFKFLKTRPSRQSSILLALILIVDMAIAVKLFGILGLPKYIEYSLMGLHVILGELILIDLIRSYLDWKQK